MTKRILWVGEDLDLERIFTDRFKGKGFDFETDLTDNLIEANSRINSQVYQGVYMGSLWINKNRSLEGISLNDLERRRPYGGGLFLVRCSKEKNLPVLVKVYEDDEQRDASSLGAEVYKCGNGCERCCEEFLASFKRVFGV